MEHWKPPTHHPVLVAFGRELVGWTGRFRFILSQNGWNVGSLQRLVGGTTLVDQGLDLLDRLHGGRYPRPILH